MKTILLQTLLVLILGGFTMAFAAPVGSDWDELISVSPIKLPNSKPLTEGGWASGILGLNFGVSFFFDEKIEVANMNVPYLYTKLWEYVIIKQKKWSFLYKNTEYDRWIDPNPMEVYGVFDPDATFFKNPNTLGVVSHVSFYTATQPVPEPTTMLLFGVGLVGLGTTNLWKRRKHKTS